MPYAVEPQSVSSRLCGVRCLNPVLPSSPTISPLQTETVLGQTTGHHSPLAPGDLSVVKSTFTLSVRPHACERSVADDALPVPRRPQPRPPVLYPSHCRHWNSPAGKCRRNGSTCVNLRYSPSTTCADGYTIPSPRSVEVPKVRPADPNHCKDFPVVDRTTATVVRPHVRERVVAINTPNRHILYTFPILRPNSRRPAEPLSASTAPTRSEQPGQQQMPPKWFDMVYPRHSPSILSNDYTIPSPTSVEAPAGTSNNNNNNNNNNVRWSSLFPLAPVVVERPEGIFSGRARWRRACRVRVRCRAPRDRSSATQPVCFFAN